MSPVLEDGQMGLISFDKFLKLGRLVAHEQARNLGLLKVIDTYEEVSAPVAGMDPVHNTFLPHHAP